MSSVSPVQATQLTLEPAYPRVIQAYPVNEVVVEATPRDQRLRGVRVAAAAQLRGQHEDDRGGGELETAC